MSIYFQNILRPTAAYAIRKGVDVRTILRRFGAETLNEIQPTRYRELKKHLDTALAETI